MHTARVPLVRGRRPEALARGTPGFSGADLANLINEAALLAARRGQDAVTMEDLEDAKDKVLLGLERKRVIINDEEKKHDRVPRGGPRRVAALIPEADPLHKVTIIPRGMALGLTQQLPVDDRYTDTKDYLEAQLSVLMGGRVAEKIFLGKHHGGGQRHQAGHGDRAHDGLRVGHERPRAR